MIPWFCSAYSTWALSRATKEIALLKEVSNVYTSSLNGGVPRGLKTLPPEQSSIWLGLGAYCEAPSRFFGDGGEAALHKMFVYVERWLGGEKSC